ncbi:MAG: class I tRNA ligase family protein [Candidatus Pacebacteria bacterium]|nr:class I tRNA ligase family protein [Candidatus Paceibacterota bacterium]
MAEQEKKYEPNKIEPKWQKYWEKEGLNRAKDFDKNPAQSATHNEAGRPKFYCLDMFPYPSGAGLHVGHPKGYTATDIISRYKRMNGFNVFHPIGWDAFGLPAENYAIKTKVHPNESTHKNIAHFKEQIKSLGFSYDWEREIDTSSPEYYKWTQWFFLFLYKNGWAYKAKAAVNWCDSCQTVLANEQAQDGKCERCSSNVLQKDLEQWFFKITDFSEELLAGLDKIDWPEPIKIMQKNWIGKSEGYEIDFNIKNSVTKLADRHSLLQIRVFTTRIDTIFGCTYLVIAPEHEIAKNQELGIKNYEEVKDYVETAKKKSERDRQADVKDKTGVKLEGVTAINPANGKEIPIFVADYVLSSYGTGAIMAVPAQDERDFEFAKKFNLPIVEVPNSMEMAEKGIAKKKINYRLRDWLVSRQRYWGAPIPIVYCEKCGEQAVPEKDLPVLLPTDVDFMPTGESPLVKSKEFHKVKCPKCGGPARRESDTMDTFVCSSWYFFRYLDHKNKNEFADKKLIDYWLPVDLYVGGAEHAVLHLLYARFFAKALKRISLIGFDEPFLKLRNVGLILAEGGVKMSKSKGNVINPDDIVKEYGADTLRIYEMFMGPFDQAIAWDTKGVGGARRFLDRIYKLKERVSAKSSNLELEKAVNKIIKKVGEDIEQMKFNTAISSLMILLNEMEGEEEISGDIFERFLLLLAPFAPHIAEELYEGFKIQDSRFKNGSIFEQEWPKYDTALLKEEKVNIVVQISGKARGVVEVETGASEQEVLDIVKADSKINKWIEGQNIKKVIFIQNKLINLVL